MSTIFFTISGIAKIRQRFVGGADMKGLILCAGKGTRIQPLSFSLPKPLLPVATKPVLYYSIEKLVDIGIKDIGIVINQLHESLFIDKLGSGEKFGAKITYIYQNHPKGIADAVQHAKAFIDNKTFILLLGDNLINESLIGLKEHLETGQSNCSIMLTRVNNPQDYGIAEIREKRIIKLVEKPKNPMSNLAIIGAYAFDSNIFKAIQFITPSARGEYEITDAIQWLIDNKYRISYSITEDQYSDVGTVERWLEANRWMLEILTDNSIFISKDSINENCKLIPPVIIGDKCKIKDSVIGPYVSISSGATIEGCKIESSIILENVHLKQVPYQVKESLFGKESLVNTANSKNGDVISLILGDKASINTTENNSLNNKKK